MKRLCAGRIDELADSNEPAINEILFGESFPRWLGASAQGHESNVLVSPLNSITVYQLIIRVLTTQTAHTHGQNIVHRSRHLPKILGHKGKNNQ